MNPVPLSDEGIAEVERQSSDFVNELTLSAGRIASRLESESASAAHVRRAVLTLYEKPDNRRSNVLISAGGVLSGAGVSAATSVGLADSVNAALFVASLVATLVGAIALTIGLLRS